MSNSSNEAQAEETPTAGDINLEADVNAAVSGNAEVEGHNAIESLVGKPAAETVGQDVEEDEIICVLHHVTHLYVSMYYFELTK